MSDNVLATPAKAPRNRESPDVRRKLLIQATMRTIAKYGYPGCTIEKICGEAKVSRGLINHHFSSKDELIHQSYKELCEDWNLHLEQGLQALAGEPEQQLHFAIRYNFAPRQFKRDYLDIWVGFWGASSKSPLLRQLSREQSEHDRALYRALFVRCAEKNGLDFDGRQAAIGLIALLDGFWLEWSLDPDGFSAADAEAVCLDFAARTGIPL